MTRSNSTARVEAPVNENAASPASLETRAVIGTIPRSQERFSLLRGFLRGGGAGILPGSAAIVWVALFDRANVQGVCWPSLNRIAKDLGLHRSTVCHTLNVLEKANLLTRQTGGGRTSTRYQLAYIPEAQKGFTCRESDSTDLSQARGATCRSIATPPVAGSQRDLSQDCDTNRPENTSRKNQEKQQAAACGALLAEKRAGPSQFAPISIDDLSDNELDRIADEAANQITKPALLDELVLAGIRPDDCERLLQNPLLTPGAVREIASECRGRGWGAPVIIEELEMFATREAIRRKRAKDHASTGRKSVDEVFDELEPSERDRRIVAAGGSRAMAINVFGREM